MRYFLSILIFLFLFVQYANAQKEAAIWYFGEGAGLDFNSGSPVALTDGQLYTIEGCSTISDANGSLLFYTDGITVWNRNHQIMFNGEGLSGNPSSTQSGLIVPHPGDPEFFFIFTADHKKQPKGINYSVVDLTLQAGLGEVVQKNVRLISPAAEKLTAVVHANGTDIWVAAHGAYDNSFHAYLVSASGVDHTPVTSNLGLDLDTGDHNTESQGAGYFKISPDGTKAIIAHTFLGAELLDFNSATGIFSNVITLWHSTRAVIYGAEFSPSSRLLYLNNLDGELFQYDTSAPDIKKTETFLGSRYWTNGSLQLAIDGKIYIGNLNRPSLSVIENPNIPGAGSNVRYDVIDLAGKNSTLGLPPFIQSYFLLEEIEAGNFCFGDTTEFSISSNRAVSSVLWDFGDGNTSMSEDPGHIYSAPGTYLVNATVKRALRTKVITEKIIIYDTPVASSTRDFEVCSTSPTNEFDLSIKDAEILGGQSSIDFDLAYYATLTDAQNGTNPLPKPYTNTAAVENITARIWNKNNPRCFDTESFDLIVKEAPVLNPVTDWTVCDTGLDGLYTFDLTEKDKEILNGQNAKTFSVSYYADQADADAATNSLPPNYSNTGSRQQIFFRLENTAHPDCYEVGSFNLEVIEQVFMNEPSNVVVCDDDNDGFYTFDLTSKYNEIVNDANNFDVNITFHLTGEDLTNRTNAVDPTNFRNTVAYNQKLFIRAEHSNHLECYAADNLVLVVNDSPTIESVVNWEVCDEDNDGIQEFDLTQKDTEILGDQYGTDFAITYHMTQADADSGQNRIGGSFRNSASPQKIYYRVENRTGSGCYLTDSFELRVFNTPTANKATPIIVCDANETGIQTFDLSSKDEEILKDQDPNLFQVSYFRSQSDADANENPVSKTAYANTTSQETVYARIQNAGTDRCYDVSNFEIIINPLPDFSLAETYVICPDRPELTIDGGDFESWSWRDGNGAELETSRNFNITDLGGYNLTVTRTTNGITCEKTVPFEVVSSGAPVDFTTEIGNPSDNVTIIVNATGTGDFEYSTDGENFQDGNRLEVIPGEHTVYVRDKLLCRTISKKVIALGYQKFFTPNNDGVHENWNIIGAYHYPDSQLYIYDRYGKLLRQISPMAVGWDGTQKGKLLPASDYWFRYVFDGGKVFTGHFSLKR